MPRHLEYAAPRSFAFEVGPYGVRVDSLSPGYVEGARIFRLEAERTGTTLSAGVVA
jgi:hypothetical protein